MLVGEVGWWLLSFAVEAVFLAVAGTGRVAGQKRRTASWVKISPKV